MPLLIGLVCWAITCVCFIPKVFGMSYEGVLS